MSGPGQVKGHHGAFSHFGVPGRLDELHRAHTHPKWWVNVREGYCMSMKGILEKVKVKVRTQKVTIKQKYKLAVRRMFSGSFCKQISVVRVI